VYHCLNEGQPALTDRLRLVQETETKAYGVVLMHPGVNLTTTPDVWPRDLASIVVRIRDLIERAAQNQGEAALVYLYDKSDSSGQPLFLGAAQVVPSARVREKADMIWLPEIELDDLQAAVTSRHYFQEDVLVANKEWTVVVKAISGTFEPDVLFVVLGGVIFLLASVLLALWVWNNARRIAVYNRLRAQAEQEKAALILDNARQAAKAERDLNDFIGALNSNWIMFGKSENRVLTYLSLLIYSILSMSVEKQRTR